MSKQVIKNYIFDAAAKTVTLTDFDKIDVSRLALITNVTRGVILFNFADPIKGATVSGNVITLSYYETGMQNTDKLRIDYNTPYGDTSYDRITVGNARTKFRDGFASQGITQPNPDVWDLNEETPGSHIITQGGDSSGASYLRISLSPFKDADDITLTSKKKFSFPMRVGFGLSMSQRIPGQEVFIGMVGVDEDGNHEKITATPDLPITSFVVTSNVATITIPNHGLKGGDRIVIAGAADHRINVGPSVVTILTADTFTIPITIVNGTYTATGGYVRLADPLRWSKNSAGLLFENGTTTNASFVSRRNGAKFRSLNSTVATTTAIQVNTNPYTDSFVSAANHELYFTMDEIAFRSYASDSNAGMNGSGKWTQNIPDEELEYKIHVRAKNLNGFSMPTGRIVSAAKSGTTTATVTTDVPHGLAAGDFIQIYGTYDQVNFPQLSTQTAIASVPTSTTFTVVWGGAVTATTQGGTVWVNHGQLAAPGVIGQSVQSVSRTNNVLTLIGSASWSGPLNGEYLQIHGMSGTAAQYDGAYKVLRISGTTLELEAPGANFTSITTGGAVIRRTDVRLHFARVMDYTRLGVEVLGGKGNQSDANNAATVVVAAAPTTSVSQSTGSASNIWNAAGYGGVLVADIASAALTSTSTSSAITPGMVSNIGTYSHTFNVAVTAITGSGAYMDVAVEESVDNGTNWIRIYEFPRITATGSFTSPKLRATFGTRFRYVRTVGGTTPSITNAVNRVMWSTPGELTRQWFDRSIVLTTLNSTTPVYTVDGCNFFQVTTNLGAATTPPVLQLQGSEDGTNWYAIGGTFTPTASTTTLQIVKDFIPKFARVIVATAGATVTPGYISLKATGM
ncbi:hypothetical protein SEA_ATUIN_181 [Arthrobacter phage Atuin]|nr:hypothetical protein SEA_ATUIN_280 [Arthrobacter phage Atuin]